MSTPRYSYKFSYLMTPTNGAFAPLQGTINSLNELDNGQNSLNRRVTAIEEILFPDYNGGKKKTTTTTTKKVKSTKKPETK